MAKSEMTLEVTVSPELRALFANLDSRIEEICEGIARRAARDAIRDALADMGHGVTYDDRDPKPGTIAHTLLASTSPTPGTRATLEEHRAHDAPHHDAPYPGELREKPVFPSPFYRGADSSSPALPDDLAERGPDAEPKAPHVGG